MSEKLKELAKTIVSYSIRVEKDEKVLITTQSTETREFINYLIDEIYLCGGVPVVKINDPLIGAKLSEKCNDGRIEVLKKMQESEVDIFDSFIQIRYSMNDFESKNVDKEMAKIRALDKEKRYFTMPYEQQVKYLGSWKPAD